ncbi:Alpha/beta hydrolase fold-1 [Hypoxylon cercidicola]|nr:Alpha/beta hydrolase fold-1 [Hypoxylon cercidicola]
MAEQEKPVILLIHGSWHIPLHYRYLIDGIRSRGYTVLAPSLVTTGYDDSIIGKTHLDAAAQTREFLLPYVDQGRTVVVIGHSYGGIVATQAVAGLTLEERSAQGLAGGVTSLIYISALIEPANSRFKPGTPYPFGWTDLKKWEMAGEFAKVHLFQDVEQQRAEEAIRQLVFQSAVACDPEALNSASEVRAAKTYVVCKKDQIVSPEDQYKRAKAAGAQVIELECGHSPFLLEKETAVLVDIVIKAAGT